MEIHDIAQLLEFGKRVRITSDGRVSLLRTFVSRAEVVVCGDELHAVLVVIHGCCRIVGLAVEGLFDEMLLRNRPLILRLGRDLEEVHGLAHTTCVRDLHRVVLLHQVPAVVRQIIVRLPLAVFEVAATKHFRVRFAFLDPSIPVNLDLGLLFVGELRHWKRLGITFTARCNHQISMLKWSFGDTKQAEQLTL